MRPDMISIPEDPKIIKQYELFLSYMGQMNEAQMKLNNMIDELQAKCPHNNLEEIRSWDSNYTPRIDGKNKGLNVLLSRRCKFCKFSIKRPEGEPWQICYNCGNKMEKQGMTLYGEKIVEIYRCTKCKHTHDKF
ncbi:MAG: hypothetical protein PHD31_01360 [Candidatus Pacebacteria bacterium]|nr:hypothetical protein [Candidatus Paceibacterota bacterium]